jgi:cytochrome P450
MVYLFLPSYQRNRSRFLLAKNLLSPLIEARRETSGKENADLLQWMVDSAQGRDVETDRLVKRMLFLNMAAIHTSAIAAANAIIELCAHPDCIRMLREEMLEALQDDAEISLTTLNKLKKTDSFLKESHRMNPLGLREYQHCLTQHEGVTILQN